MIGDTKSIDKMSPAELRSALKEARGVITDLMTSHAELLPGVKEVVCDYGLLNQCRLNGDAFLRLYR